jgi:glycerol-3-phosphate dehydrogenase
MGDEELDYLCRAVNRYLKKAVTADDVRWSFAGVRPLFDDGTAKPSEVSRDYALELDRHAHRPPLLSVYGGKLTTYRKLAERALDRLAPEFPKLGPAWTADVALPGGDFPPGGAVELVRTLGARHAGMDPALLERLVRRHGSRAAQVLAGSEGAAGTGVRFGADLYAFEVDYFVQSEWARSAEDVLWRRSKSGLRVDAAGVEALSAYLQRRGV